MTAKILDGKLVARQIREELRDDVADFIQNNGEVPTLATVLVGEDPASEVYVRNKVRGCEQVGMQSRGFRLPADASQDDLLSLIAKLNRSKDEPIHGILVQLPLPKHIDAARVLQAVSPMKDVDGFHPDNVGRMVQGRPRYLPCTPFGIQQLLVRSGIEIPGRHVVVVGRSDTVGKPMALLLMQRGAEGDATVTVCHSKTPDLAAFTRQAEILVVAIGQPRFVTPDMVRPGAVVVDVGIHRTESGLVGDVDSAVNEVAGHITPVPGGVGPMTVTMLLVNTLAAARQQQ
ncbi:MAG: bifunctional methylenetetrahydrofolate dehydrogenase/methenyltetrahydrofolate cyclohydrolase FolD [Planctomycetota bacterium]|nr:MAG: bifunctional methylenetetrahydrofolate dehydrogenase/methenyltetrahydrofolate cyclohydrolase FolD [Planctomycetota bacterium]